MVSSNPIYVGSLIGRTLDAFSFKGAFIFVPLFMNIEFGQTSVTTSLYYGTIGMIAFTSGIIAGGFLINKFHHEGRKAALFIAICSLFCGIITISQVWIPCDNLINRVGAHFNHTNCLGETCVLTPDPICDSVTGESYASACHAGCRIVDGVEECACTVNGTASFEDCDLSSCAVASLVYMGCTVMLGLATGCSVIPGILVMLWYVCMNMVRRRDEQSSFQRRATTAPFRRARIQRPRRQPPRFISSVLLSPLFHSVFF